MGKENDEAQPPAVSAASAAPESLRRCRSCVTWRCLAVTLLSLAVLLSAVVWLPPFDTWHTGIVGDGNDGTVGADIVASFRLERTVSELQQNISKLEYDIYDEIGIPGTIVSVTSLEPLNGSDYSLNGSNISLNGSSYTTVIFSIFPYPKNTTISPTWISILRSSFMSLVVEQSTLHLTSSLFGNSSSFEVLKYPGGITIIPPQSAFLLLKPHAFFNFTLNFPISKVQGKIEELKDQMKMGLLLNSYENLFVKLTNLEGSTVNSPTIIQTSIILQVGNHQPSHSRLRQLAQTITNSSSKSNLGLNHTTFGRVKQISLSSYLRHSLANRPCPHAPSPAPGIRIGPSVDPVRAPSPSPSPVIGLPVDPARAPSPVDPVRGPSPVDRVRAPSPAPVGASVDPVRAPAPAGCRFGKGNGAAVRVEGPGPASEAAPPGRGLRGVVFEHVHAPSESESERRERGGGGLKRDSYSPALPPQNSEASPSEMVKIGWFLAPVLYLLLQWKA